jgi:phosphatidylglycerophosphate synthase
MDWIHVHLALNHVPVMGTPFVTLLLVAGVLRGSREIVRLSLWAFVLLCAVSIPIKFTGDFAEEQAEGLAGVDAALIERHEQAADRATTGMFVLGLAAAASLIGWRGERTVPGWAAVILLMLGVATSVLMAWAANSGGAIRHPEIRSKPASAQQTGLANA